MATKYDTGNAVGSADPRDLFDNSIVIDEFANSDQETAVDRLGQSRRTLTGLGNRADELLADSIAAKEGSEEWAQSPDPISIEAGGDGSTDRSSKWWAEEAETTVMTFDSASVLPDSQQFAVGDSVQSVDLGNIELHPDAIKVFIDGVYQFSTSWDLTEGVLTPVGGTWPGDGVAENMEVIIDATTSISFNVPSNGSVTEQKLSDGVLLKLESASNIFSSVSAAETSSFSTAPESIVVLGYYSAGDGGEALYHSPTTTNPSRSDTIEINVDGTPTWLFREHNYGAIDLIQHGLRGEGFDETVDFQEAIELSNTLGINKVICRNPLKNFLIEGVSLSTGVELDLGGATLLGNFTEGGTTATMITASISGNQNIVFKNMTVDAGNTGNNPSGEGNTPPILITGGDTIEFDRFTFVNGSNRGDLLFDSIFDFKLGEVQVSDARRVYVHHSELGASPGEILTVQYSGANAYRATKLQVEHCNFYKERSHQPGTYWSNSSIVAYNVGKGSFIRDCQFGYHIKSAVNWFGPCVMERCTFEGVMDSQAADFDEAANFGIDQIVVKDCFFQDVKGGYAIRVSGRQVVIDGVEINRCENGIIIESAVSTRLSYFEGVGVEGRRPLYNVFIRNVTSNGNDVVNGDGDPVINSLIRINGATSSVPIFAHIEGTGVQLSSDSPSANPEYGIHATNAFIYLKGAFQHGRSAMVFAEGLSNVVCRDCQFYPQANATTHVIQCNEASVRDILVEDCWVFGDLDAGFYHITISGSSSITGQVFRNRSDTFNDLDIGSATLITDYN